MFTLFSVIRTKENCDIFVTDSITNQVKSQNELTNGVEWTTFWKAIIPPV